jgi:hypothetical protein
MKFEIDVSGYDMWLEKDYAICVAKDDGSIIKGFKFNQPLVDSLIADWKSNKFWKYPYDKLEAKKGRLKVRIYSIIIYYLFKSIEKPDFLSLTICRDFKGRENEIKQNFKFLLEDNLGINMGKPLFQKLRPASYAHIYAGMMRNDKKNLLSTYITITLEDIEKYLIKKKKKLHQGVKLN